MEFSADTKSLAEALDQVQEAVDKKSTIPILSHALVEASATGLRLAATDLELGIRVFCPASVKVPGSGAIAIEKGPAATEGSPGDVGGRWRRPAVQRVVVVRRTTVTHAKRLPALRAEVRG